MWSPFLKKGFGHCYVIERLEYIWMMFDPTRYGLNVMLPDCDVEHPLVETMMSMCPDLRALRVTTRGDGKSLVLKPKLLSCVSTVEFVMGVGFGLCLTPHQLFKKLLRCKHPNLISVKEIQPCQQVEAQQEEQQMRQKRRPL